MSTFSFRLIKYTYRNRIQYDDGPGSFRHIVADESSHVRWERHNLPESFGTSLLEHGITGEVDSPDGWHEYRYVVERQATGTDEWKYVGDIRKDKVRDINAPYDDYPDQNDFEEKPEEYHCFECGAPVTSAAETLCEACELEEQTKYHERELEYEENPVDRFTFHECAWCNTDFEGEGFLCEECDTRLMEMERESVRDLFRFRILSQDWWENIYYHLYWYWRGLTRR